MTLLTSGLCRVSMALGRSKQGRMVSPWAWLFVHKTAAPVATWLWSDGLPGCLMGIGWGAAPEVLRKQDVKCPKPRTGAELLCLGVQGSLPIHPLHIWHQGRDLRRAEIIMAFCHQRSLPATSAFSHFENKRPKKTGTTAGFETSPEKRPPAYQGAWMKESTMPLRWGQNFPQGLASPSWCPRRSALKQPPYKHQFILCFEDGWAGRKSPAGISHILRVLCLLNIRHRSYDSPHILDHGSAVERLQFLWALNSWHLLDATPSTQAVHLFSSLKQEITGWDGFSWHRLVRFHLRILPGCWWDPSGAAWSSPTFLSCHRAGEARACSGGGLKQNGTSAARCLVSLFLFCWTQLYQGTRQDCKLRMGNYSYRK